MTDKNAKLILPALEKKLWGAADILRGTVDSGDYKNYIFGLLALKRLNDEFLAEVEALKKKGFDDDFAREPENHVFYVPETALWKNIPHRENPQGEVYGLGEAFNMACRDIERHEANKARLENVLTMADFNDTHKLGDEAHKRAVLTELYNHFNDLHLADKDLEDPDILGRAYEYLIKQFAEGAGKKGGEFFTPPEVVQLMVELVKPQAKMRILDPTVGSGGFLLRSARYVREHSGNGSKKTDSEGSAKVSLYGQEINGSTWSICKLNMLLHGRADAVIMRGDSIRNPLLKNERGGLIQAERVLANPPFSLDKWGYEYWEKDPHGRNKYGTPPKTKGDWAFIQHMLAHCSQDGMVATVVPHGVLFRGAAEGRIRTGVLDADLVEAVIGLGPNIFYGTGIPAAILILNNVKPKERKGKVLFINASETFRPGKAQNYLDREHIDAIVQAFEGYADKELFARVVDLKEIKENDYNLNITRYVDTTPPPKPIDVKAALAALRELEKKRNEAEAKMHKLLTEMGYA
jgi:type I restriction enzyme M protein